ncbi:MAG: shikimate dehydrogenase [Rhodospirillales bacterium]|nr:shikimate dehydrogenase [Rhodospirillales bacterium]
MPGKSETIKAAVIGHPVAHSLSPLIHAHWIGQYGLHGSYEALDIAPDNLVAGVQELVDGGYTGFNVTIPHKQAIMKLCAEIDETAQAIGAVNTVKIDGAGRLYGRNTDAFGFIENIVQTAPDFDFTSGPALIFGAGGAARALAYGLKQRGVPEIRITNRTREKAEELAADFDLDVIDWDDREAAMEGVDLLVNSTALGMTGKPPLTVSLGVLPETALVCDIVYKPLMTDLLAQAQARSNPVVTGLGMLLHQARPAFEGWFGMLPEVTPGLQQKAQEAAR